MKTVIQKVMGTIASAYRRSKSVAMRGASACVDSLSCAHEHAVNEHELPFSSRELPRAGSCACHAEAHCVRVEIAVLCRRSTLRHAL